MDLNDIMNEIKEVTEFIRMYDINSLEDIEGTFKINADMLLDKTITSEQFVKNIETANKVKKYFKERKTPKFKPGDKVKLIDSVNLKTLLETISSAMNLNLDIKEILNNEYEIESLYYMLTEPCYYLKNDFLTFGNKNYFALPEDDIRFNCNIREARETTIIPGPAVK